MKLLAPQKISLAILIFLSLITLGNFERRFDGYGRRDSRLKSQRRGKNEDKIRLLPKNRYSGKMYFAVAADSNGQIYSRIFNKTLANITQSYIAGASESIIYNITLETLVIELPEGGGFSSSFLQSVCKKFEGKHIVAILITGNTQAAFTVSLAARHAGIPVLWARGTNTHLPGFNNMELSPFEVHLEPTSKELMEALRALFIQTHWHTFTILADDAVMSSVLQRRELVDILDTPPLHPTILQLPSVKQPHWLFRRLADISRSTRGVVILICDRNSAGRVLDEGRRLNMVDGHFVWLWIDTVPNNITFEGSKVEPTEKPDGKRDKRDIWHSNFNDSNGESTPSTGYELDPENVPFGNIQKNQQTQRKFHTPVPVIPSNPTPKTTSPPPEKYPKPKKLPNSHHPDLQKPPESSSPIDWTGNTQTPSLSMQNIDIKSPNGDQNGGSINQGPLEVQPIDPNVQEHVPEGSRDFISSEKPNGAHIQRSADVLGVQPMDSNAEEHVPEGSRDYFSSGNVQEIYQTLSADSALPRNIENLNKKLVFREKRSVYFDKNFVKSDLSEMQANFLVKNDKFLFFNRENDNFRRTNIRENLRQAKREQWKLNSYFDKRNTSPELPSGLLTIRAMPIKIDKHLIRGAVKLLVNTLKTVLDQMPESLAKNMAQEDLSSSCWNLPSRGEFNFSTNFALELREQSTDALAGRKHLQESLEKPEKALVANFEIANLVPEEFQKDPDGEYLEIIPPEIPKLKWRKVGHVTGRNVHLDTIVWPGGGIVVSGLSSQARSIFRIVTALAPPFVMETGLDEDGQCLRGLPCHRVLTSDKDNLTLVFNEMETQERLDEEEEDGHFKTEHRHFHHFHENSEDSESFPFSKYKYRTNCCYGLAMDLLENIARELQFDFRLYIVADGFFGTKVVEHPQNHRRRRRDVGKAYLNYKFKKEGIFRKNEDEFQGEDEEEVDFKWNGIVGDLVSGAAHMSFAALSVSSTRSEVIDFSTPFFYSGVSFLAAPPKTSEFPLLAFLLPFSPELWIAIFTSLNVTAIAVAIYEWLSPFGLNPWGRQRSKNFSMSSALWVMWGLLCGHLVAFKAPKSWPNKFLINVWGGFSVIFVASYTANIAALIAGLFFQNTVSNYNDRSLLSQKVGAPKASAAEYYVKRASKVLWEHMHRYSLENVEDGIERLRNGSLEILIADTPILDYYRATDNGCTLQKIGDTITEDAYAVGMTKGFPLKDSISAVIAKYASNGYMDILQEKWYGGLPCFKLVTEIAQPRPLGVTAVTGVFILLGCGMILGCLILIFEHLFYRYTLPILRHKPKGTIWKSRNIMFFSQKLYRFINCVELVSPHHAARELVHTLRQGQITSLFQKSVKRKEHEQRRRRKSKAQFFEMIQEIRRQQQEGRQQPPLASLTEVDSEYQLSPEEKRSKLSPNIIRRTFLRSSPKLEAKVKSPQALFGKPLFSPRSRTRAASQSSLNVRRYSTDSVLNSQTLKIDRSSAIGRRLSKDASFLNSSPPDINSRRSSYLDMINSSTKLAGKSPVLSIENVAIAKDPEGDITRKYSDAESIGRKLATFPKYKDQPGVNPSRLHPGERPNLGKSDETLSRSENYQTTIQPPEITSARSFQNIPDTSKKDLEAREGPSTLQIIHPDRGNLSDDEITRRNKLTIEQLRSQLNEKIESIKPQIKRTTSNQVPLPSRTHPAIRIEDTSKHDKFTRSLDIPDQPKYATIEKSERKPESTFAKEREELFATSKSRTQPKEKPARSLEKPELPGRGLPGNTKSLERPELPPKPDILREKYGRTLEKADFGKEKAVRTGERPELPPKEKLSRSLDRSELGNKSSRVEKMGKSEENPAVKPSRMEKRLEEMCRQERASWTNDKTSWSMDRRMEEASRMEQERSFLEKSGDRSRTTDRRVKHRHRSLGDVPKSPLPPEPLPSKRKSRIAEHSRSLDGPPLPPRDSSRIRRPNLGVDQLRDVPILPPAPPPPNCSPRGIQGRSPLQRLSKDELVDLWRSSESEIRSHLLKAIRDKNDTSPS